MSIDEFYLVDFPKGEVPCINHSLRKWKGLRPEALESTLAFVTGEQS